MRTGDHAATWSFDSTNEFCAARARGEYLAALHACGTPGSDFFSAELIYRELVSNALRHSPGDVSVELRWSEHYLVLNVHDEAALFFWTGELPLNPLNDRGRGLYLVNALARSLHIKDSIGRGSKISAVLPIERKCDLADLFDFADVDS